MSLAKVTIVGQEQFLQHNENKSLFDLLQLPDGIDKDLLVDNILLESGDFESMYDNPYFMRNMISVWGRKWYRTFEKWVAVLNMEYNPLENYDRKEFWEDQGKMNRKQTQDTTDNLNVSQETSDTFQSVVNSTSDTTTTDVQASESNDTQTSSGTTHSKTESEGSRSVSTTTENLVSAYDASTYQPSDESIGSTSETASDESTTDGSTASNSSATTTVDLSGNSTDNNISHSQTDNTDNTELSRTDARTIADLINENRGDNNEHRGRIHGNIGVKTTQSMLAEELEVQRFNIINEITDIFVTEFCVLVYD